MIEKILKEINRLKKELNGYSASEALDYIEAYINTLPEESTDETNCTTKNDDLEEEINNYIKDNFFGSGGMGFFSNRTKQELNSIDVANIANHFAEWQKQQMMKDALDGCVSLIVKSDTSSRNLFISTPQLYKELQKYEDGDKVKIIICKNHNL